MLAEVALGVVIPTLEASERLGLSRQKTRRRYSQGSAGSPATRAAFGHRLGSRLGTIARAHPGEGLRLWCRDGAKIG